MAADAPVQASYELTDLQALEAEAVHVIREVAAEFERPVLLFSGGKDSAVMLHVAVKAFAPARLPFPVMHVDTGHNFAEVIEFRDRRGAEAGGGGGGGGAPGGPGAGGGGGGGGAPGRGRGGADTGAGRAPPARPPPTATATA